MVFLPTFAAHNFETMPTPVIQAILVKSGESEKQGALHATAYDQRDRVMRAAKVWVSCWVVAPLAFFTFIPVVHLLTPLALFVTGPVLGVLRYRVVQGKQQVHAPCPACSQAVVLSLDDGEMLPKWAYCPACGASLHIISAAGLEAGAAAS